MPKPTMPTLATARPSAKTATGFDGSKIRVGDAVESREGVRGIVLKMWRQGYDGTIIVTDTAPDPDFPSNKQGVASSWYKRVKS